MNLFRIVQHFPVLLLCMVLSGCFLFHPITSLPRDVAILTDHARAKSALARGDLNAAENFLTGESYQHRSREVEGTSWGELSYQAAQVVLAAHACSEVVDQDALFQAYMVMSYSYDLPVALDYLAQAQRLLDGGKLSSPDYKRRYIFEQRFPRLLLYRYLESGGRIDWYSEIQQDFYELYFRSPPPKAGEHDPRDFYRFLVYLTLEDREWLFANRPQRASLDEAIWRDEAKLLAFSRTVDYYYWYDDNRFDWQLSNALSQMSGPEQICMARKRGYDVIPRSEWDIHGVVDPETCQLPAPGG